MNTKNKDNVRDADGTLNVRKYEEQQDRREAYARASGIAVTGERNAARVENLRTMPDKALNSLYNASYPVSSNTHRDYEVIRQEMIRRGFIMSA